MDNFKLKYRPAFMPVTVLTVLLILVIVLGNFVLGRIGKLDSEIRATNTELSQLTERVATLRKVEIESVGYGSDVIEALPTSSPALMIISRLRTDSSELNLLLDNINIDSIQLVNEDLSQLSISFDIEGAFDGISDFIVGLEESKPLINLETISLTSAGNVSRGSVTVTSFWAPLPELLPAISDEVADLSESERQTLDLLSSYTKTSLENAQPEAQTNFEPRSDPFSQ